MAKEELIIQLLKSLTVSVAQIQDTLKGHGERLTAIEKRLDAVEKRLDAVEKRLDAVEVDIKDLEKRLGVVEDDISILIDAAHNSFEKTEDRLDNVEEKTRKAGEILADRAEPMIIKLNNVHHS